MTAYNEGFSDYGLRVIIARLLAYLEDLEGNEEHLDEIILVRQTLQDLYDRCSYD